MNDLSPLEYVFFGARMAAGLDVKREEEREEPAQTTTIGSQAVGPVT